MLYIVLVILKLLDLSHIINNAHTFLISRILTIKVRISITIFLKPSTEPIIKHVYNKLNLFSEMSKRGQGKSVFTASLSFIGLVYSLSTKENGAVNFSHGYEYADGEDR